MPARPPAETAKSAPDTAGRRMAIFTLIFIGFAGLGTWTVYDQFAGKTLHFDFRLLTPRAMLTVAALLAVYFAADGLRLHFTLRALGHSLALSKIFRLVFINIFFSNITPMATGGGFAQVWYLQRNGVNIGTATAATTIRTLLAVIIIFTLTPIFLLTLDALDDIALLSRIAGVLALLIALYLGFFTMVLLRTRWLLWPLGAVLAMGRTLQLLTDDRHRRWHFKLRRELLRFSRSFALYIRGPRRDVLLSVLFTFVFLLSLFSFPALLIVSLGYDSQYLTSLGLMVVTTFIMYFAPTPGASGISEGVFGAFFSGIISPAHLVLVTVGWRFLTIYLGMLIGLVVTQWEIGTPRQQK